LRDVYIERGLGGGTLTIGQFKPFRTMDELTSSNYLTVMERGFTSASGIFSDRQWQQGAGWLRGSASGSFGVSVFSLREDNTARNDGWGAALRSTYAPLLDRDRLLHLGVWGSYEQGGERTPGVEISAAYGGRRGPSALLFESAADIGFGQRSFGLEFAGRIGSLYWQSEWSRAILAGDVRDARLEAKYLQASWLFGRASKKYDVEEGLFGGLEGGGEGQWEAVARVDYIRLRQSNNVEARRYVLGINHYFSDDVRLMLNWVSGEDRLTNDEPEQLAMRLQYVF
jgi:phosphate-selective porin OprO/OprP